jgi:pimeloyl-ACP methyl ester carboxylesterase
MDKEIRISGKNITYRVYGEGKPVMLVHGFGETGEVWKDQVMALQDSNILFIVPDLPGSGRSDLINDMSVEGMAEVLKSIYDHEAGSQSSNKRVIIGHSMGGYIMLAFLEKYPGYCSAFGMFHSTAFADTEEKKATRRKGIDFIREHGAYEFLKTSTPNLFSQHTKDNTPELITEFIQSLAGFSAETLIAYYEAMIGRPERTAILKNAKVPVLFVMGEYDNAVPLQDGLKQCHWPQQVFIHIMHQSGHMGMMEEPAKSNAAISEFLTNS